MMNITHLISMPNIREIKLCLILTGNMTKGDLKSKTARKLVREWVDLHNEEIARNWDLAMNDRQLNKIAPLD